MLNIEHWMFLTFLDNKYNNKKQKQWQSNRALNLTSLTKTL